MRGAIFETWVPGETLKHRYNQGLSADLTFWRDNHGLEVDLVFEHAGRRDAVEIKSGATFVPDWFDAAPRCAGAPWPAQTPRRRCWFMAGTRPSSSRGLG